MDWRDPKEVKGLVIVIVMVVVFFLCMPHPGP